MLLVTGECDINSSCTAPSPDIEDCTKVLTEIDIQLWEGGDSPFSVWYNEMGEIEREAITIFIQRLINDYPVEGDHLSGLSLLLIVVCCAVVMSFNSWYCLEMSDVGEMIEVLLVWLPLGTTIFAIAGGGD
jgi:hypothetical protein